MKVVIHQPMYLPYLGFFDKLRQADTFVILDDAEFSKGEFFNRNRVKTMNGISWLTVPVKKGAGKLPINQVEIVGKEWILTHLGIIRAGYRNSPYFDEFFPVFENVLKLNFSFLDSLNMLLFKVCMRLLHINVPIVMASDLKIETTSTQRLVDICKKLDATEYLSGIGARDYLDESLFEEAGIKLRYQEFEHPVYKQQHGEFVPNLSVLDYLMNEGAEPFWKKEKR